MNNQNNNKKVDLIDEIASKNNNGNINENINISHAYELVNKNNIKDKNNP